MEINEITAVIKKQLEDYDEKVKPTENGVVISYADNIATVYGIKDIMYGEMVEFQNKNLTKGMAFNLEEDFVKIIIIESDSSIVEGTKVKRLKKIINTKVGDEYLGRVVDGIGIPIDEKGDIKSKTTSPLFKIAPPIMHRKSVNEPLQTGIMAIDSLIPIGKGQRQLIIGDRQTGKSSICIDTILNQQGKDVYCVYVSIGQRASWLAKIINFLHDKGAMKYTTVVSASASESSVLQYLSPYTACSIAEYWMSNGKDVLIIYDDLSKHAVAYRTISLLMHRPPGREAYPGDIFYIHSSLLERSAKLNKKMGGGSITAFPIVETQAGEIAAYIPTNIISITDGQIFLQTGLFNSGQLPAVDVRLSVSRIGGDGQLKSIKMATSTLRIYLAQYNEVKEFSQFSSDLDKTTLETLNNGLKIMTTLKQPENFPIEQEYQILILLAIKYKFIKFIPKKTVTLYKKYLFDNFESKLKNYKKIVYKSNYTKDDEKMLIKNIKVLTINFLNNNLNMMTKTNIETIKKLKEYNPFDGTK